MVLLIVALVVVGFLVYKSWKSYKVPNNSIICFTGTLGSGKTYLAVAHAIRAYRSQRLKHFVYRIFKPIAWFIPEARFPASLYSNIPVQINLSRKKPKYAQPFTKEHLLMKETLPERCVVLVDELGQMCSQWEFDNPYVMQNVQTLVRFFRHFTNGKMFVTDQVSDNIVKPIRDRLGFIYQLNDFHRVFGVTPFYEVNVIPILSLDNGMTNVEQENPTEYFFFGFLPYRWMKFKHYESRCFRKLYTENAVKEIRWFDSLYTTYLIDLSVSRKVKKQYKENIDDFKDYLYDRSKKDELTAPSSDSQTPAEDSAIVSFKF